MSILPILLALLVGLAVGLVRGGQLARLWQSPLRWPALLVIAVPCAFGADALNISLAPLIAMVGLAAALVFALANLNLIGMGVIAFGIVANLAAIGLNGAMPVRADALVESGMVAADDLGNVRLHASREFTYRETKLAVLGDVFPVPATHQVVSLGDLIILVGLADVIANLLLGRSRRLRSVRELMTRDSDHYDGEPSPGLGDGPESESSVGFPVFSQI